MATQVYFIEDNDPYPFKVMIEGNGTVKCFRRDQTQTPGDWKFEKKFNRELPQFEKNPCFEISDYEQLYIGNDYGENDSCGGAFTMLEGVSFLIHERKDSYIYIGTYIGRFKMPDGFVHFSGHIGNNSVANSYAVGRKFVYLLEEEQVIMDKSRLQRGDVYSQYYGHEGNYKKTGPKPRKLAIQTMCESET